MSKTYYGGINLSTWDKGYYTAIDSDTGKRVKVQIRKGRPRSDFNSNGYEVIYKDRKRGKYYDYMPKGMVEDPDPDRRDATDKINEKVAKKQITTQQAEDEYDAYNAAHPTELKDVEVIADSPHKGQPDPTAPRTGIDIYAGQAAPSQAYMDAYNEIGFNPIFNDIRVRNYQNALARNPMFSYQWDMANNINEFINASTGGLWNRLSPTQNIRYIYDTFKNGWQNPLDYNSSWWGNNGIVTDEFAAEHPYWTMGINGGVDLLVGRYGTPGGRGRFVSDVSKIPGTQYAKDLWWLGKTYNNSGSGLGNSSVRRNFLDLARDPTTSRNFIETYSRDPTAGLTLDQIREALPQLRQLETEFGISPKLHFNSWTPVSEQIETARTGLDYGRTVYNNYTYELDFLKNHNKVLYDIAKESPQYLRQIVLDYEAGRITNVEDYVRNLIKQANTFVRRMDLSPGQDATEAFSTIGGHTLGENTRYSMDVGNPNVVWAGFDYGKNAARYTPKELHLEGPVETWWSQRRPTFADPSISINPRGIHTDMKWPRRLNRTEARYNTNLFLEKNNVPYDYNRSDSHMIFLSPNRGASIGDWFNVTPLEGNQFDPSGFRYTLGYQKGGKL